MKLLERFRKSDLLLEIEAGVVGGEEDGVKASGAAKLYTTPEDTLEVARRLNAVAGARYLLAATFGNVHGVYKPGHVKLKPSILKDCQDAVVAKSARRRGSTSSSTAARARSSARSTKPWTTGGEDEHRHRHAVRLHARHRRPLLPELRRRSEGRRRGGNKKAYDPRSYLTLGEAAMAERVKQAVKELRATGTTMAG